MSKFSNPYVNELHEWASENRNILDNMEQGFGYIENLLEKIDSTTKDKAIPKQTNFHDLDELLSEGLDT